MKYTISEFAELLGVTVDTLRLYEKYDIVKPVKDKRNNYRYYDDFDARNMLMSRWYRSLEFPMQEAALLIKEGSTERVIERIKERKKGLEEEIEYKKRLLAKLEEITENFANMQALENKCEIRYLQGIYRITQTDKNSLRMNQFLTKKVEEWMKFLPFAFFSFLITKEDIEREDADFDYNWGLALEEKYAKVLGVAVEDEVEYIKPQKCITANIKCSGDHITRESMGFILDYIRLNNLSVNGDIFGKIIITEKSGEVRNSYLEVNIPIE